MYLFGFYTEWQLETPFCSSSSYWCLYGVMVVCYLIVYSVLYLLEWDIPMSMCAMHILYAHWFSLVHMLNFMCYHMLICHFDSFWTTWMTSDVIGSINGYVFICPICISLDFGRLVHAYLLCVNSHALFALFDPIYKGNSIMSLMVNMCTIFKDISICT